MSGALRFAAMVQGVKLGPGHRIAITIRLPPDVYREAAKESRRRGWSMSDFIGRSVAAELEKIDREAPGFPPRRPTPLKVGGYGAPEL